MNDDFDDLDRALFALPLAEPPPDLRRAILRATVWQAAAPSVALRTWETALVGAVLAFAVWLFLSVLHDPALVAHLEVASADVAARVAEPSYLVWLATGVSIATWVTLASTGRSRTGTGAR